MLRREADLSRASDNSWTPLNPASRGGLIEPVQPLLRQGADPLIANVSGQTPLDSAAYNSSWKNGFRSVCNESTDRTCAYVRLDTTYYIFMGSFEG